MCNLKRFLLLPSAFLCVSVAMAQVDPTTIIEIGDEYQHLFRQRGGEKVQLVESLNDHPLWIKCLKELVLEG